VESGRAGPGKACGQLERIRLESLARSMVTFVAFIPFFAFAKLGFVLGEGKLDKLFFRRRSAEKSDLSTDEMP
jgi:hypothetical protein